jgi:hypothetical protein
MARHPRRTATASLHGLVVVLILLLSLLYASAASAHRPAGADFNHDGISDLVLQDGGTAASPTGNLKVLLGNIGQFELPGPFRSGIGASAWQGVGDFNGDGISDVALQNGSDIDVLLGNIDRFEYAGHWRGGIGAFRWAAVGDFNGDHIDDIVLQQDANVDVLLGNVNRFEYAGHWRGGIGASRWQGVGDFNGDGISDVALQNGADIDVLLGNINQFQYAGHWRGGIGAFRWGVVGDFNRDNIDDIALQQDANVDVLLGNVSQFQYGGHWRGGIGATNWAGVGDFNRDGIDDLALYGPGASISVLPGNLNRFEYAGVWRNGISPFPWAGPGSFAIDETKPTLSLSGGLYDARNASSLTNGSLSVFADDNLSGVTSIKLYDRRADGSRVIVAQQIRTCWSKNCPTTAQSLSATLNPATLGWTTGSHPLDVEVTDNAGNVTTLSWSVKYYATSWNYGGVANRVVDTAAEIDSVLLAIDTASSEQAVDVLTQGLYPGDAARLGARLSQASLFVNTETEWGPVSQPDAAALAALGSDPVNNADATASAAAGYPKRGCRLMHDVSDIKVPSQALGGSAPTLATITTDAFFCWDQYKGTTKQWPGHPPSLHNPSVRNFWRKAGYEIVQLAPDAPKAWWCINTCGPNYIQGSGMSAVNITIPFDIDFCPPYDVNSCGNDARKQSVMIGRVDGRAQHFFWDR